MNQINQKLTMSGRQAPAAIAHGNDSPNTTPRAELECQCVLTPKGHTTWPKNARNPPGNPPRRRAENRPAGATRKSAGARSSRRRKASPDSNINALVVVLLIILLAAGSYLYTRSQSAGMASAPPAAGMIEKK